MRNLLFRGKRTDNGEWICSGNIIHFEDENLVFIPQKHDKCGTTHDEHDNILSIQYGTFYKVNPATVGQFTGLIDKDGVPIYEGDIIHTHYANCPRTDFIETVVFHDGRFCAEFGSEKGGKMWSLLPSTAPHLAADKTVYMEWCKVIGNIHDDPEGVRTNEDNP